LPQVLGATDIKKDINLIEFAEYKVQKGDTLFNISQKYNINWATLATLNNLKSPFVLKPGQIIKIPK
jgi:LysM repeat protein